MASKEAVVLRHGSTVYLSGAITGVKDYEFNFAEAEAKMKARGFKVVNPCKLPHNHDKSYERYMREDLEAMLECDAVVILKDSWRSRGVKMEKAVAKICGIPVVNIGNIK